MRARLSGISRDLAGLDDHSRFDRLLGFDKLLADRFTPINGRGTPEDVGRLKMWGERPWRRVTGRSQP
ncbi:MAG TPA: hypothetical protein VGC82_18065, partial [Rhodopila sp.]